MNMLIDINLLDGEGLQARAALNEETVEEYTEIFLNADKNRRYAAMPPVSGIYNGATNHYWLTDGFHRVAAAKNAGMTKISVELKNGERIDALREALKANVTNGLRRTNADKRKALTMAWEARQELFGGEPSNGLLAEACGISERTVNRFRLEFICDNVADEGGRIDRKGHIKKLPKAPITRAVLLDKLGQAVPDTLRWAFTDQVAGKAVRQLAKVVNNLEELTHANQVAAKCFKFSELDALRMAVWKLRRDLPYVVCTHCGGKGCEHCHDTGFLSRTEYDKELPEFKVGANTINTDK